VPATDGEQAERIRPDPASLPAAIRPSTVEPVLCDQCWKVEAYYLRADGEPNAKTDLLFATLDQASGVVRSPEYLAAEKALFDRDLCYACFDTLAKANHERYPPLDLPKEYPENQSLVSSGQSAPDFGVSGDNLLAFPTKSKRGRPKVSPADSHRVSIEQVSKNTYAVRIRWKREDGSEDGVVVNRLTDSIVREIKRSKNRYEQFKKQTLISWKPGTVRKGDEARADTLGSV